MSRQGIKKILGQLPFSVDLYWHLVQRHKPWHEHYNLAFLESIISEAVVQAESYRSDLVPKKRVFIFSTLHYWIEYCALLGLTLAGKGHQVTLSYLPYASWDQEINAFDLRRQDLYTKQTLEPAYSLMSVQSLLDVKSNSLNLPEKVIDAVNEVSVMDTQYALQIEDVTKEETLYHLRYARNYDAALAAKALLETEKPDVVIVPNGTIQEMGVVYRVAQYLNIPNVTFEFGDQRERIWIAKNDQIMRQNTDDLWVAHGQQRLKKDQLKKLELLYSAREAGITWANFARQWQEVPTSGSETVKAKLGLDGRPVILLATNVLGDSLTLGRQIFSKTMSDWIQKITQYFVDKKEFQLIIRIHPGEMLTHGTSMGDVVKSVIKELPEHIHLIEPDEKINTYDLMDITNIGLVYTTTVGLEMAMRGIPVIVAGHTHYCNRGFTYDPATWDEYLEMLENLLHNLDQSKLSKKQVELSLRYAYLFFFEFPQPFPWHLVGLKKDYQLRPIEFVLSEEGAEKYHHTFEALVGHPINW